MIIDVHNKLTGTDKAGEIVYDTGRRHITNWYVKNKSG